MSNDQFALSIGQAQQLEFAFSRNDWTPADVHKLCEGETLGRVKSFLGDPDSSLSHGFAVAFQSNGTSRDLLEQLAGPYSWEWRHHSRFFCSEREWEEWRKRVVGKFVGVTRGDLVTISRDDLQQLEEAAQRKVALESENSDLRKVLRHFHRPITDVFSKENCQRVGPTNWNGSIFPVSLISRILPIFEYDGIATVGDLVRVHEAEILRWPNVGRTSLNFIKAMLADMDLHLGMEVPDQM
jgi:hypothetical protein